MKEANAYHFRLNRETLEHLKAKFVCGNESKPREVLSKKMLATLTLFCYKNKLATT